MTQETKRVQTMDHLCGALDKLCPLAKPRHCTNLKQNCSGIADYLDIREWKALTHINLALGPENLGSQRCTKFSSESSIIMRKPFIITINNIRYYYNYYQSISIHLSIEYSRAAIHRFLSISLLAIRNIGLIVFLFGGTNSNVCFLCSICLVLTR